MLTITVPGREYFDEETSKFVTIQDFVLEFEHSLASVSKWESIYEKPFLSREQKSTEEVVDYIKAMLLTPEIPEEVFSNLSNEHFAMINDYINKKMTATWFPDQPGKGSREVVTSELIYYWMIAMKIPREYEHWHLNKLFTLIRVVSAKNQDPKKQNRNDILRRQHELNQQRRAAMGTTG